MSSFLSGSSNKEQQSRPSPRIAKPYRRWAYLGLLFVYLFALAMTLFEIDAFQALVAQASKPPGAVAVDNFQVREILQAARIEEPTKADGSEGKPDAAQVILLANLAQRFDSMRAAVDILNDLQTQLRFARLTKRNDTLFRDAQRQRAKDLVKRLAETSALLKESAAASAAKGASAAPAQGVRAAFRDLDEKATALAKDLAAIPRVQAADATTIEKALKDVSQGAKDTSIEAKKAADKLKTLLADIEAKAKPGSEPEQTLKRLKPEVINAWATALDNQVAEFRALKIDPVAKLLAASLDWPEMGPSSDPGDGKEKQEPSKQIELKAVRVPPRGGRGRATTFPLDELDPPVLNALRAYAKKKGLPWATDSLEKSEQRATALRGFQAGEKIGLDGRYGSTTAETLNAFIVRCKADPECNAPAPTPEDNDDGKDAGMEATALELARMANALEVLERALDGPTPDQKTPSQLDQTPFLRALAQMELAAFRLDNLKIETRDETGTSDVEAERVREIFDQSMNEINGAVEDIRKSFGENSRVTAVARAFGDDPHAYQKAQTVIREYGALTRYQPILTPLSILSLPRPECPTLNVHEPHNLFSDVTKLLFDGAKCLLSGPVTVWNHFTNVGFSSQNLATMPRAALDLLIVSVMGAVGSLIYLVRYLLTKTLQNIELTSPLWRPWSWYLFRPIFGIVVAFAIYLLYKTGQVAMGGATGDVLGSDVNLPILSIVSLFAGLLSWQALELVEAKGRRWLAEQERGDLWAYGLQSALDTAGKTRSELALQIGVTVGQVDRWISFQDKVTPEMQDRILTWLGRQRVELFSRDKRTDEQLESLAWAVGLKEALDHHTTIGDVMQLAQVLNQDVSTVTAWVRLDRQVPKDMQHRIAEVLSVDIRQLFDKEKPGQPYWAFGLRKALAGDAAPHKTAESLAAAVGSTQRSIRGYMELRSPVPKMVRERIAAQLGLEHNSLCSMQRPNANEFKWAPGLRQCMGDATPAYTTASLADAIDTEQDWVREWVEQTMCGEDDPPYCGQAAPETQKALEAKLKGCDPGVLFRAERVQADFRWARMPALGEAIEANCDSIGAFADRIDVPAKQLENWLAGQQPIAPGTQQTILDALSVPLESRDDFFTREPPIQSQPDDAVMWATGLRDAVDGHPGLASLLALAGRLQVSPKVMYDIADLLQPVDRGMRERIRALLGPSSVSGKALFERTRPDWSQYVWAPRLRTAMRRAKLDADALARAVDTERDQVRAWMEQDVTPRPSAVPTQLAMGQLPPALQARILNAINKVLPSIEARADFDIFSPARNTSGALYARHPVLQLAIDALPGGRSEFEQQVDVSQTQIERWNRPTGREQVLPATQDAVLKVLGLGDAERGQLFSESETDESVVG